MGDLLSGAVSLVHLGEAVKGLLTLTALCSLRIYVAMLALPVTNDQALQGVLRNGVALSIGIFTAWGQPMSVVEGVNAFQLAGLMVKEGLLGLLLGFAVAVVFWVAESVGVLIDNQAGYNNVQQTNPLSGEQSTPVGNMLSQLAISSFYMLGGMLALVGLIFESYHWWPLNDLLPAWPQLLERFAQMQVTAYTAMVLKIAAPVVMVLVLIDLGIGLISKTADKLEPNNLAQPIKGAVALLMLVLFVAVFFEQVRPQLALQALGQELQTWLRAAPR